MRYVKNSGTIHHIPHSFHAEGHVSHVYADRQRLGALADMPIYSIHLEKSCGAIFSPKVSIQSNSSLYFPGN